MLWTLADPRSDGLVVVEFPYFETEGVHFSEPLSYVPYDEPLASPDIVHFNHGLAEVITALMNEACSSRQSKNMAPCHEPAGRRDGRRWWRRIPPARGTEPVGRYLHPAGHQVGLRVRVVS